MLTISSACFSTQASQVNSFQEHKPQTFPKFKVLNKDTLSFKAREREFIEGLSAFIANPGIDPLYEKIYIIANEVERNHADIRRTMDNLRNGLCPKGNPISDSLSYIQQLMDTELEPLMKK